MPEKLKLCNRNAEFDGFLTVEIVDEQGILVKTLENIDVIAEHNAIATSLNDDEKSGAAFLRAVRRHLKIVHDVEVSAPAADAYYQTLVRLLGSAENFFIQPPVSSTTTESIPGDKPSSETANATST